MDQVLKIKKDLEKAAPANDAKKALDLLRALESIPMTLDLLTSTHIGMTVNKTRKALDNNEVSSLSKSMVKKWKKLLSSSTTSNNDTDRDNHHHHQQKDQPQHSQQQQQQHQQKQQQQQQQHHHHNQQPNSPQLQQYSPYGQEAVSGGSSASSTSYDNQSEPRAERRPVPVETTVPTTTSDVRLKCRQLLSDALKKPLPKEMAQEAFLEEDVLAARIEDCIYQEFRNTDMKYKTRVRSRVSNLSDMKNPYLRLNVLRGDILPERIAKMTADDMASDELKKEREKYTKEAINDHQMTLTSGTKTSEIKCPACKKYDVTYNQVQTRSADEPMTTFCYCNECGKRWKFC